MDTHASGTRTLRRSGIRTGLLILAVAGIAIGCVRPQTGSAAQRINDWVTISGHVYDKTGGGAVGVTVSAGAGGTTEVTDDSGSYEIRVPYGWSGSISVQHVDYRFAPPERTFNEVQRNLPEQQFLALRTDDTFPPDIDTVWHVDRRTVPHCRRDDECDNGLFCDGSETCGLDTRCHAGVSPCGDREACDEKDDACVPLSEVAVSGFVHDENGNGISDTIVIPDHEGAPVATDREGYYLIAVPAGWSGTLTPLHDDYLFSPPSRNFTEVMVDQEGEDYTGSPSPLGAEKQTILNNITRAAHAMWDQRGVLEGHHTGRTFYGYCGKITVDDPVNRYYFSDGDWVPEPHVYHQEEHHVGHAGVGWGFLRAYEATRDRFLLRAAKELGDTLLSIQGESSPGNGFWYDVGLVATDRMPDSPTYGETIQLDQWTNLFAWGSHLNLQPHHLGVSSFDGVSAAPALFLLRLYQACPEDDPDRGRYLEGAGRVADAIVGLKDAVDPDAPDPADNHPYENGGIPGVWPIDLVRQRLDGHLPSEPGWPALLVFHPTTNDYAMANALFFLIEFWREAQRNPALDDQAYLDSIRLNIQYLEDVFNRSAALQPTNRGGFAQQYDLYTGLPSIGREIEPPAFDSRSPLAEHILLKWWEQPECSATCRADIEDILERLFKYWKYDVAPVNSRWPECPGSTRAYDAADVATWEYYKWYSALPDFRDCAGNVVPLAEPIVSDDNGNFYYNDEAMDPANVGSWWMWAHRNMIGRIRNFLDENNTTDPEADSLILHEGDPDGGAQWRRSIVPLDADLAVFHTDLRRYTTKTALDDIDDATGLVHLSTATIGGRERQVISDQRFFTVLKTLTEALEELPGSLEDSDGDGFSDIAEAEAGTDLFDSADHP
ncbi:MAG: hypothetical protein KJ749_06180 [Planctomycetes bacterium]|nr:hypothetical protein [Planctomycetota bacterium]